MPIHLAPLDGYLNAGESAIITATLYDPTGMPLSKVAIQTLTLAIIDPRGEIVNNRGSIAVDEHGNAVITGQDILDVNGGSVANDGTVTIKLSGDDTQFTMRGDTQTNYLQVAWSWLDPQAVPMSGKQDYTTTVKRVYAATMEPLAPGWLG